MKPEIKINKMRFALIVQAVCIAFLLLKCFDGCDSFSFSKDSFEKSIDGELTQFGEDAVGLEAWPDAEDLQGQQPEGFELLHCRAVLGSGAYQVKILYESASSRDMVSIDQSSGSLRFHTQYGAFLKASELRLADGLQEAETRFWLRPGCRQTEVNLSVWHNGSGRLAVKEIRIEEKRVYRVVVCAAVALFMAFCDFLYLVFVKPKDGVSGVKKKWLLSLIHI